MSSSYDIIGDVHGRADALFRLLTTMGYMLIRGMWRHPERKALFLGDYIDAGPDQRSVVDTVRGMVEADAAVALMGNHEFNAICWFLPDPKNPGDYLRSRYSPLWGEKNRLQHLAFLEEFEPFPSLHQEAIAWFLTLPLWFESEDFRAVHACWDQQAIDYLSTLVGERRTLSLDAIYAANNEGTETQVALDRILKGQEIDLPAGTSFLDGYDIARTHVRRKWWDASASTYRTAALLPSEQARSLPEESLPRELIFPVDRSKLTFFGHYCLADQSPMLTDYFACIDSCAAKGKHLTAYRWDGELQLHPDKFIRVAV